MEPQREGVRPEQVVGQRPQPAELVQEGLQRLVGLASVPASELVEHRFGLVGLASVPASELVEHQFGLVGLAFLLAPEPWLAPEEMRLLPLHGELRPFPLQSNLQQH